MQVISGWQGFILVASVLDIAVSVPSTWSNCWPNPSLLHTTNLGPCPGTTVASLALQASVTGSLQREMELFRIVSDDNSNYWSLSFIYTFPSPQLPRGLLPCVRITDSIWANFSHHLQTDGYIHIPFFFFFCSERLTVHIYLYIFSPIQPLIQYDIRQWNHLQIYKCHNQQNQHSGEHICVCFTGLNIMCAKSIQA